MKFKNPTILKVFSILFLIGSVLYTAIRWQTLSNGEGWGVVFMLPLILVGFIGLILDFILTKLIKNKWLLNIMGLVIILLFCIEIWQELNL